MIVTLTQLTSALARTIAYCKEINTINSGRAIELAPYFGGVVKKYGVDLKTQNGSYIDIGDSWSAEFFIKHNRSLNANPSVPSLHFCLVNDNDIALILALSKEDTVSGHPCESFFLGDITLSNQVAYFDSLETTIADGSRHHVYLEHHALSGKTTANVLVYIDGALVVANNFPNQITNFKNLIFGCETFIDEPNVENLAVFDSFRLLGSCQYLSSGNVPDTITMPTSKFEIDEDTLILYQNGMLNVFIEDESPDCSKQAEKLRKQNYEKIRRPPTKSYSKICPVCGKSFETSRSTQIYCGTHCKKLANQKIIKSNVVVKKCIVCGKSFETNKPTLIKTCSKECSYLHHLNICNNHKTARSKIKKTCPVCGVEFEPYRKSQIYCSIICRDVMRAKRKSQGYKTARLTYKFRNETYTEIHRDVFFDLLRAIFNRGFRRKPPANKKPLDDWIREADACGMSYGKYRAAVEVFGKSFEELKSNKYNSIILCP